MKQDKIVDFLSFLIVYFFPFLDERERGLIPSTEKGGVYF